MSILFVPLQSLSKGNATNGADPDRETYWRVGRVVECGGLENR